MFSLKIQYILSCLLLGLSFNLYGHEDEDHAVAVIKQQLYKDACSECHMAYPAGLLPEESWQSLMGKQAVAEHFGEDLYLEEQDRLQLLKLLREKAAQKYDRNKLSRKFARAALDSPEPMIRMSKTRFYQKKHEEIPQAWVLDNPDVVSYSNCSACHGENAEQGVFNEDDVVIPNYEDQDYD